MGFKITTYKRWRHQLKEQAAWSFSKIKRGFLKDFKAQLVKEDVT